jgi:hypothetical protein
LAVPSPSPTTPFPSSFVPSDSASRLFALPWLPFLGQPSNDSSSLSRIPSLSLSHSTSTSFRFSPSHSEIHNDSVAPLICNGHNSTISSLPQHSSTVPPSPGRLTCIKPGSLEYDIKWDGKVKVDPVPFPFIPLVKRESDASATGSAGISMWRVQPNHILPGCPQENMPRISDLMNKEVEQIRMAAVSIDEVERTEVGIETTVIDFLNANREPVTPEEFLKDFVRQQPPHHRMIPYLKDIVWPEAWEGEKPHFLNTVLLSESKSNLCSLMTTGESPIDFPGFLTGSWFCKGSRAFFGDHMEQLFGPSLNVCYMGGTTWWCVKRSQMKEYEEFLIQYLKTHLGLEEDSDKKWTPEQSRLLLALLYAKKTFIDPSELVAAGIEVYQLDQKRGDVVMLDGDIVHWGVCDGAVSINEAINFLPVSWLIDGLLRLDKWMDWLQSFIEAETGDFKHTHSKVKRVIFNDEVRRLVGKHCPRQFTLLFFQRIKTSIQRELITRKNKKGKKGKKGAKQSASSGSIDYRGLEDDVLTIAISRMDKIAARLEQKAIKDWYNLYCDDCK